MINQPVTKYPHERTAILLQKRIRPLKGVSTTTQRPFHLNNHTQSACLVWIHRETHLVLSSTSLGELKGDTTASKLAVDLGVGVEAVVDAAALLLVENDLEGLGAVLLGAEALADNLDGEDEVSQDGVVDGGQGAGAGALLGGGVARAGGALGAREDAARGEDQDVAVGELLLELTGETAGGRAMSDELCKKAERWGKRERKKEKKNLPLLDAVEALQGRDGDKDGNSLLAVANLDLLQITKSACELPDGLFDKKKNRVRGPLPVLYSILYLSGFFESRPFVEIVHVCVRARGQAQDKGKFRNRVFPSSFPSHRRSSSFLL